MRLLVTGGAGFIGGVVVARLAAAGHEVTVADDPSAGLLTRLVFSSSAAVYGNPVGVPIPEGAVAAPTSPYGWTKLAVDMAIKHECAAHGLGPASLRYLNVAGAARAADGRILGERHHPETHLIPIALEVAAGLRERLEIFGTDYPTADGTCIRDCIHVEDLATAHLLALDAVQAGRHAVINLGDGTGFSNRQVVDVVRAVTGAVVPLKSAPRRPGDPAALVASSERARAELGWLPSKPDLRDIVADAWAFLRSSDPS